MHKVQKFENKLIYNYNTLKDNYNITDRDPILKDMITDKDPSQF